MREHSNPSALERVQQRLQRRSGPAATTAWPSRRGEAMGLSPAAMRLRLAHHRRVPGRVTAVERVMRRLATPSVRNLFMQRLAVQVLATGTTLRPVQRIEVRQPRGPAAAVHTLRQQVRTVFAQRVLHQRVIERLSPAPAVAPPPRVSTVTRVEHRHAAPRIALTLVRTAPATAQPAAQAQAVTPAAIRDAWTELSPPPRKPAAAPLVLPAQELSRVTDHVIREFDRRVLSWQERTARI